MADLVETVARAMRDARIYDEEGQFAPLFDLLDFSGENKAHTVVDGLARAAIALRDDMIMRAKMNARQNNGQIVVEAGFGVWLRFNEALDAIAAATGEVK